MQLREKLRSGLVIPAHPLALNSNRKLDERRQRALTRYYLAAGAGGIAVGVHTTQFEIRDPKFGLLEPVLSLAMEESRGRDVVKIAGVCGKRQQAIAEAELAAELGYDAVLLSLAALTDGTISELIEHSRDDCLRHPGHRILFAACGWRSRYCRTSSGVSSLRSTTWSPLRLRHSIAIRPSTWCAHWLIRAAPTRSRCTPETTTTS